MFGHTLLPWTLSGMISFRQSYVPELRNGLNFVKNWFDHLSEMTHLVRRHFPPKAEDSPRRSVVLHQLVGEHKSDIVVILSVARQSLRFLIVTDYQYGNGCWKEKKVIAMFQYVLYYMNHIKQFDVGHIHVLISKGFVKK